MSEQDVTDETLDNSPKEASAAVTVRRGGLTVGLVIVLSLAWYLMADRFTPYTDQARLQG